jgi:DNA-binding protein HU-beta
MAVKYSVVAKANPRDPSAPKKHYPEIQSTGRTTVRNLAEQIAAISTVSPVDVAAVIEAFLTIVPKELANGNIVALGDFGSFSLRTRGEGAETAEQVTGRNITKVLTTFRPGKRFKEALANVNFEKAKG